MKKLIVTKASGETAIFEMDKLRQSMHNSGASDEQIEQVVKDITPRLYEGISTKKICQWAFSRLKKTSNSVAARYQLKRAIMDFGPSGFPFEEYIGNLFQKKGYHVKTGIIVNGSCVKHEIDVIASNDHEQFLVECKFHSQPGKMSDVKVPLYIRSRFLDVYDQWIQQPELKKKDLQGWVVTNTRFSPDAIKYGRCIGLNLLSWDYPINECLKSMIDEFKMYPITCLTSLTIDEKTKLLELKTVMCEELIHHPEKLSYAGITQKRQEKIIQEISHLLKK